MIKSLEEQFGKYPHNYQVSEYNLKHLLNVCFRHFETDIPTYKVEKWRASLNDLTEIDLVNFCLFFYGGTIVDALIEYAYNKFGGCCSE